MKTEETLSKYVHKLRAFDAAHKRKTLPAMQGVQNYLEHYTASASALELKGTAQLHLIGMRAALSTLRKSASGLGLFSDAFEENAERLAEGICTHLVKDPAPALNELMTSWIELSVITTVGLVELGRTQKASKKEGKVDQRLKEELLLSLLFSSGYPRFFFQTLAEGVGIAASEQKLFIALFELVVLCASLIACSTEEEWVRGDLITHFRPYMLKDLEEITQALDRFEVTSHIRALLEQIKRALIEDASEAFIQAGIDLAEGYGYRRESLYSDLDQIKSLFKHFKEAYQASKDHSANLIHLVG